MIITDYLKIYAEKTPNKIAVNHFEDITYKELYKRILNFSNSIPNISENSVISLVYDNSIDFLISYLGIIYAGHIAHLMSPEISKDSFEYQTNYANPEIIILDKKSIKKIQTYNLNKEKMIEFSEFLEKKNTSIKKNHKPGKYAYLLFTSGTTARPKGVAITHLQAEFTTKNIIKVLGYNSSDVNLVPLPFFHSFGLGCVHTSILSGASLIIQKNSSNVKEILECFKNKNATTFAAVPATLTTIIKNFRIEAEEILSNSRLIMTNSTSIPVNTVKEFKKILRTGNLATYYGLTEASRSTFMIFEKNLEKDMSVGIPAPGVQIKIKKENNGKNGIIMIKGNNVIQNYWNDLEADKFIKDGWIETGDIGYIDSDGFLYLSGRKDYIINVAGNKVNPYEIENVVKKINGIEEAIAVGKKHETFGNVIKLIIKKSKDFEIKKSEIIAFCIKNMERYKVPIDIEFVEEFPKTEYGKIKRFMLQQ